VNGSFAHSLQENSLVNHFNTTKPFARLFKASLTSWGWSPKYRQLFFQTFR
jgi:hypothetical protein